MSKPLPPLDHLRAFEAAARHLSFKEAASDLNVTPAAIGQRIRSLESTLQRPLFVRRTRQIALTQEGRMLFDDISPLLAGLRASISRHWERRNNRIIRISTTNSFTELNLLPALPGFTNMFPDADVRIVSTNKKLDLDNHEADVSIRLGPGGIRGCNTYSLGDQDFVPVCSPVLFANFARPTALENILDLPLIEEDWPVESTAAPSWKKWAKKRGLDFPSERRMIKVSLESHAVRAATQAQGVALVRSGSAKALSESGMLVELFSPTGRDSCEFCYRLVWRRNEKSDLVMSFVDWAKDALK